MDRKISVVSNPVNFIKAIAFFIKERGKFCLCVMNWENTFFYKEFKTFVGTKISFSKNFGDRCIKPNWTDFTPLGNEWKPLKWVKKMIEAQES